ncbi:MAG TPA: hypothetical protein VIU11_05275 [Nakamurella sp.]
MGDHRTRRRSEHSREHFGEVVARDFRAGEPHPGRVGLGRDGEDVPPFEDPRERARESREIQRRPALPSLPSRPHDEADVHVLRTDLQRVDHRSFLHLLACDDAVDEQPAVRRPPLGDTRRLFGVQRGRLVDLLVEVGRDRVLRLPQQRADLRAVEGRQDQLDERVAPDLLHHPDPAHDARVDRHPQAHAVDDRRAVVVADGGGRDITGEAFTHYMRGAQICLKNWVRVPVIRVLDDKRATSVWRTQTRLDPW